MADRMPVLKPAAERACATGRTAAGHGSERSRRRLASGKASSGGDQGVRAYFRAYFRAHVQPCASRPWTGFKSALPFPLSETQLMPDRERRMLLAMLLPLLWLQRRYVRRITLRMPEPPGNRAGSAGRGALVRLLVAGDSGAAGWAPRGRITPCAANWFST